MYIQTTRKTSGKDKEIDLLIIHTISTTAKPKRITAGYKIESHCSKHKYTYFYTYSFLNRSLVFQD